MQEVYYRLDRESRIASLVIDTVGAVNTVGEQFITDLETATRRAAADRVAGIIIRSAKRSSFLDGADLAAIRKNPSPAALELLLRRYQAVLDALASNPFPVAAVLVEQTALGGGFELLLWACDRIFATPGSKMGLPEVNVGLFPAAGGLETLKRLVGFETALDIVLGGRVLGAHAFAISEPVQVIEADRIAAAAESWIRANPHITNRNMGSDRLPDDEKKACRQLIAKARKSHTRCRQRPWFDALLTAAQEALDLDFRQAVDNQIRHFAPLIADRNVQNKIDFFFTSTRVAPKLASVDAKQSIPVDRVAVIGAGLMGRGIAQVCADNGLQVLLFDIDQQAAQHARDQIAGDLEPLVQKGRWPASRRDRVLGHIQPSADHSLLSEVSLVIESVFEDLELKRQVLSSVQSIHPEAVFATNTSALPIADITTKSARPQQVVGMHYFSPVPLMPLLEVVRGPQTSPAALATAVSCGQRQKKTCIVVGDGPGFYTSRTFGVYVLTGFYLAEMGVDPWEVDRLAVNSGFAQGPLHVYGTAGGKVIYDAAGFLRSRRPDQFTLPKTIERMVKAGYVGAGRPCFYKNGRQPDKTALQFIAANKQRPAPTNEQAGQMLLLSMVNQAFLCMDDGVLADFFTMDLGAVLGVGFPDCWHGPARYVGQLGVRQTRQRLQNLFDVTGLPFFKPAEAFDRLIACGVDRALV